MKICFKITKGKRSQELTLYKNKVSATFAKRFQVINFLCERIHGKRQPNASYKVCRGLCRYTEQPDKYCTLQL